MASRVVSGAASMVWADHPDWSPKQVKDWLLTNARVVNNLTSKCRGGKVLELRKLSNITVPPDGSGPGTSPVVNNSNPQGSNVTTTVNSPGATTSVTTNVTGPSGVNVTVTVNVTVNGQVVPLQETGLGLQPALGFHFRGFDVPTSDLYPELAASWRSVLLLV